MAEGSVSEVIKDYEKEIEEEDVHTGKDYASNVQPAIKRYISKEHTKIEDKLTCEELETLITMLEKKVAVEKDRISELRAAEISILKVHVDFNSECELRPEHKRANINGADSGIYSSDSRVFSNTDSRLLADTRVFTDNKQPVTIPVKDAEPAEHDDFDTKI